MSGKETKDSKGKKEGKKETVSRGKRSAAEGAETDAGTDVRKVRIQKNPEVSLLRVSVKTATTYSPTCAVPSA